VAGVTDQREVIGILIGRDHELAELDALLRRNRPVLLVGPPGIGKSSLGAAAARNLARPVFAGGGLSSLSWRPYLALERALRRSAPRGDAEAVASLVSTVVGDGTLLVDDLQWCDGETLSVLTMLAGELRLVTTSRGEGPGAPAAFDTAQRAGFEVVTVAPLTDDEAAALVRCSRPGLSQAAVTRIIKFAVGNPLLLTQLDVADDGPLHPTVLAARLSSVSLEAQRALWALALLGRPARAPLELAGTDELLRAGLVVEEDAEIRLRHDHLGEMALADVDEHVRRDLHRRLAACVQDPGEAARHHAAAGDRDLATTRALEAAERASTPGERARHLATAADNADGALGDRLRLEAAQLAVQTGDWDGAGRLCAAVRSTAKELVAEARLYLAQSRWFAGDREGARQALHEGLALVDGTMSPVEVRLRLELVRFSVRVDWELDAAVEKATAVRELAVATGVEEARAESMLGSALLTVGSRSATSHFHSAMSLARSMGDVDVEMTAANSLATAHLLFGEAELGRAVAGRMAGRAHELGLLGWELQFRHLHLGFLTTSAGRYHEAVVEGRALLEERVFRRNRHQAHAWLALALACLGDDEGAVVALSPGTDDDVDRTERSMLLWVDAERAWLAGNPTAAVEAADSCVAVGLRDFPATELADMTRRWAQWDQGAPVDPSPVRCAFPVLAGLVPERDGLVALSEGRWSQAVAHLDMAGATWRERDLRSHLRCRWAAGEARLRAGDRRGARQGLLRARTAAQELQLLPLVRRIEGSLRRTGWQGDCGSDGHSLSKREAEVLRLVAKGLSSNSIGKQLGLSPRTIDSYVDTAKQKLGARTRLEASLEWLRQNG
jgi:DNA-binding CsgD family transcriptional regulator